ncbi:predicted protein [Postia placenta Mad-698-R]|nr:predicted protein [Postia placenta Mad-698-R]
MHSPYVSPASMRVLRAYYGDAFAYSVQDLTIKQMDTAARKRLREMTSVPGTPAIGPETPFEPSTNSEVNGLKPSPTSLARPQISSPRGLSLFSEFPRACIVLGDAERLEREVMKLVGGMERDGVDVRTIWVEDGVHDVLMMGWWDERVRAKVWGEVEDWLVMTRQPCTFSHARGGGTVLFLIPEVKLRYAADPMKRALWTCLAGSPLGRSRAYCSLDAIDHNVLREGGQKTYATIDQVVSQRYSRRHAAQRSAMFQAAVDFLTVFASDGRRRPRSAVSRAWRVASTSRDWLGWSKPSSDARRDIPISNEAASLSPPSLAERRAKTDRQEDDPKGHKASTAWEVIPRQVTIDVVTILTPNRTPLDCEAKVEQSIANLRVSTLNTDGFVISGSTARCLTRVCGLAESGVANSAHIGDSGGCADMPNNMLASRLLCTQCASARGTEPKEWQQATVQWHTLLGPGRRPGRHGRDTIRGVSGYRVKQPAENKIPRSGWPGTMIGRAPRSTLTWRGREGGPCDLTCASDQQRAHGGGFRKPSPSTRRLVGGEDGRFDDVDGSVEETAEPHPSGNTLGVYRVGNRWACPKCHRTYKKRNEAIRHLATVHGNKEYRCPACDWRFNRKDAFKRHYEGVTMSACKDFMVSTLLPTETLRGFDASRYFMPKDA